MEREVGGGIGMGNTCKPLAVSFQCMTKSTTNKKKNGVKKKNSMACQQYTISGESYLNFDSNQSLTNTPQPSHTF